MQQEKQANILKVLEHTAEASSDNELRADAEHHQATGQQQTTITSQHFGFRLLFYMVFPVHLIVIRVIIL